MPLAETLSSIRYRGGARGGGAPSELPPGGRAFDLSLGAALDLAEEDRGFAAPPCALSGCVKVPDDAPCAAGAVGAEMSAIAAHAPIPNRLQDNPHNCGPPNYPPKATLAVKPNYLTAAHLHLQAEHLCDFFEVGGWGERVADTHA